MKSRYNPRWEELATKGQLDLLETEIATWKGHFEASLQNCLSQMAASWMASIESILSALESLRPSEVAAKWPEWRETVASLNEDAQVLREDYLIQLGPTALACLNLVTQQIQFLEHEPERLAYTGSLIFEELRNFQLWTETHGIVGEACANLCNWLENLGLELISRQIPHSAEVRAELERLWTLLQEQHGNLVLEKELARPTGSLRWNSFLALLQACEVDEEDTAQMFEALAWLDQDVDEVGALLGEPVEELVHEYFEASYQLRELLEEGKALRGWSQVFTPILLELDQKVPRETGSQAPISRVRSLCSEFESGLLSTEEFQAQLGVLANSLAEGRLQARVSSPQHPTEQTFLEAVGKLEGGLEILTSVERSSQAGRLEMGCALIEDGLNQLQKLETT